MKKFNINYDSKNLEINEWYNNLAVAQSVIINGLFDNNFKEYETVWITEYNFYNRKVAEYYFSLKPHKFKKIKVPLTDLKSYENCNKIIKFLSNLILKKT